MSEKKDKLTRLRAEHTQTIELLKSPRLNPATRSVLEGLLADLERQIRDIEDRPQPPAR